MSIKNLTYNLDLFPLIFPTGDYKLYMRASNREGVWYANATHVTSIKSSDKDSWG
jgi:hypothetical protein